MQDNSPTASEKMFSEYSGQIKKMLTYLFIWALLVVVSMYLSGKNSVVFGFLLGFISSVVYFALMAARIRKSADLPPEEAVAYMRFGWIIRLVFVLAVLVIALKLPNVDFLATVFGILSLKFVIIAEAFVLVTKSLFLRFKN